MNDFYKFLKQSEADEEERIRRHHEMYPRPVGRIILQSERRAQMDARLDLLRIPDMAHGALAYINERNPFWKQWQTERVRGAFTAAVECTMIEEGSYGRPQVYAPHKETVFLNGHKLFAPDVNTRQHYIYIGFGADDSFYVMHGTADTSLGENSSMVADMFPRELSYGSPSRQALRETLVIPLNGTIEQQQAAIMRRLQPLVVSADGWS